MNFEAEHDRKKQIMLLNALVMPVLMLALSGMVAEQPEQSSPSNLSGFPDRFRSFEYGSTYLREAPDSSFIALDFSELPETTKSGVNNRLGLVLRGDALPHGKGRTDPCVVDVRVFAAHDRSLDDLVEYQWTYLGQRLRALTGRNAIRLDIQLDELVPKQAYIEGVLGGRAFARVGARAFR